MANLLALSKRGLRRVSCLIVVTLLAGSVFLISVPLKAETLFDSTTNPIFGLDPVSDGIKIAASFSTGNGPVRLSNLTLRWRRDSAQTGDIRILLLNDNNGRPGSVLNNLALIDSRTLPTGDQWLSIPIKNEKALKEKNRYWIEITASGSAGFVAYSRERNGQGVATESYVNMYGLHRNTETGPYIFKLTSFEKNTVGSATSFH